MSGALMARYWKAQDPYDPEALATCRHPQWSAEWPQTGERIPSHDAEVAIHANYPGYPRHEEGRVAGRGSQWAMSPLGVPIKLQGAGHLWIAEARLSYPDQGVFHNVGIFELKDGLVFRERLFWAEHAERPAWRADLVEPIPEAPPVAHGEASIRTVALYGDEAAHRVAIGKYFDTISAGAIHEERRALTREAIRALYHQDAVEDLVHSGERVRGLDNMLALVDRHPDFPTSVEVQRIIGSTDLFVAEARLVYEQGVFWEAKIMEFRGDKVASSTVYYARESEPPDWRRRWVEPV